MTFEGSINHGWIYALMGVSKTEASCFNGATGALFNMEWLESSTVPLHQISTYYYITPVKSSL